MLRSVLLAGIPHGFTGVAEGDLRPGRPGAAATAARIAAQLGGDTLRVLSQVHGARVVDVAEADGRTEADAVISTDPAAVIAVRVADCVPILLAAPGAVAAVHAGWRGTAADILRLTVAALSARTGAPPAAMRAVLGPAIGPCCYEVGSEVIEAVGRVAPGEGWRQGRQVDLRAANAAIGRALGLRVEIVGPCTRCDPAYWSHRRDGEAGGRQAGVIRCG